MIPIKIQIMFAYGSHSKTCPRDPFSVCLRLSWPEVYSYINYFLKELNKLAEEYVVFEILIIKKVLTNYSVNVFQV